MINSDEIYWLCSFCLLNFFGNACTKSGPLRFSQFSGCWLIVSVCWHMSFAFPFGRLLGVRYFCYYPYSCIAANNKTIDWTYEWGIMAVTHNVLDNWDRGKFISTYLQLGRSNSMNEFAMLYHVIGTIKVSFAFHHF